MTDRFADQVVLVTGGAQGLGRAMVERFAAEGATVHAADLNPAAGAETLDALGDPRQAFHEVNIADPVAARTWVDTVAAAEGRIDVIVSNAGIIRDNRIENISPEAGTPSWP